MKEVDGGEEEGSQHSCFPESEHCYEMEDQWSEGRSDDVEEAGVCG